MAYLVKKIKVAITLLLLTSFNQDVRAASQTIPFCGENLDCFPCETGCWGKGFISADLIYWRAFQSGLEICVPSDVSETITSDGDVISTFTGKGRTPHFNWNPGFRIGAGYEPASNSMDFRGYWTHLDSDAHNSIGSEHDFRWNLSFDVIDLMIGYDLGLNSCFSLRPFIGLRGARIDQKFHGDEFSVSSSSSNESSLSAFSYSSLSDLNRLETHNKQKFYGIGPLLGLEGDVNIWCDFSLYASASFSWLYGNLDIHKTEIQESEDTYNSSKIRRDLDAIIAAADAEIGIRWHKSICENMKLILQVGLEHHSYFDFNRFCDYGDLNFDGINFSAAMEF